MPASTNGVIFGELRRMPLPKLSKKSGQRQDEGLRNPPKRGKRGLFRCVMPAIPTLETPPSAFLDSFPRGILGSPPGPGPTHMSVPDSDLLRRGITQGHYLDFLIILLVRVLSRACPLRL
jgi:hypothetical protein